MSRVSGSPGTGFRPAPAPGSREHAYALRRRQWRAAFEAWIAADRPEFLALEPTPETPS
jgi:hypothetical protein